MVNRNLTAAILSFKAAYKTTLGAVYRLKMPLADLAKLALIIYKSATAHAFVGIQRFKGIRKDVFKNLLLHLCRLKNTEALCIEAFCGHSVPFH